MEEDWCKHEGAAVLLVEGKDDCHVILALCETYKVPETFGIFECGGDNLAIKRLNALIAASERPKIIGLLLDADRPNLAGRWNEIIRKITHHGYVLPQHPSPDGTIVEGHEDNPKIGVWLMPNNRDSGMLEDFCGEMIETDVLSTMNECINLARSRQHASFKDAHFAKAVLHTYLAMQDEPGMPMGQAITAKLLKPETDSAKVFVRWLTRLFAANPALLQVM